MDETYKSKIVTSDKIAFLGLFIVALVIAYLIVASKAAITLSEPIGLKYSGLSVSVPIGNGWQSEKQWKFRKNGFTLSSVFVPARGGPTAFISCRYLLAAATTSVDTLFKQKAATIGGTITNTDQINTDNLAIDWAHIRNQKTLFQLFFGTAQLPNSRQLDIHVHQLTGDTDLAERVFKRVTENLKFEDNQLLQAGREIITKIKNKGLDNFLHNQSRQAYFLIKDADKNTIGFTMDVLIDQGQDDELNIQGASSYYIRGQHYGEQVALFQSDNRFDKFIWKSETSSLAGRSGTKITVEKGGAMTISKFNAQTEKETYQPGPTVIPDIFLQQLLGQLLDSDYERIMVDLLEPKGQIIPTLVSRETEESKHPEILPGSVPNEVEGTAAKEAGYILKLELLNGDGLSELVYLNDQKQISKMLLQRETVYILESTSVENIMRQFPERAEYLLRENKILKQNQP
jgi:hypothetical protein